MTARFFVDTNILLYAGSNAPEDAVKRARSLEILRYPEIGFSAQVLQEYFYVAYRKRRLGITFTEALHALRELSRKPVLPISSHLVIQAVELSERFQISYWDAAIVAAAKELACEAIYTEDLNSGQVFDGIQIINPYSEPVDTH